MDEEQQAQHWCQLAAKGDRAAATKLLHAYYQRVFSYLRRLSESDDDAADLTQETFIKVWQSVPKYQARSRVTTWIHRIAYCTWVDWIRKRRPTSAKSDNWWLNLSDDGPHPSAPLSEREQQQQLWRLVRQLPEEQAQAIHLRYGQQLSLKDTAEVLDLPLSTLKLRIRTALDQLRRQLETSNDIPTTFNLKH
jgi:RNA polymerase sigma-70 factor, ECF subfamily